MSPSRPASGLLNNALQAVCLVLLLIAGQQGAVAHELGHLSGMRGPELSTGGGSVEPECGLCPSFAQVATPAFSHSWVMPALNRAPPERRQETLLASATTAIPTPRSRGPPLAS
ncbi:MAG: hypothetical protein ABSG30_07635 [Steroidobacteraceae bacterium]